MDPNAALAALRALLAGADDLIERDAYDMAMTALGEAADLFAGLDQWLSSGGFLPSAWEFGR